MRCQNLRFGAKKDIWFIFIIWGTIVFVILISIFDFKSSQPSTVENVLGFIIIGSTVGVLVWIWFGAVYIVNEDAIKIKFGPFRSKVNINEIKKIRKVKSILSAPALSVERLEITYGKFNLAYVSPNHEKDFIQLLLTKNPHIQLDEKLHNSSD